MQVIGKRITPPVITDRWFDNLFLQSFDIAKRELIEHVLGNERQRSNRVGAIGKRRFRKLLEDGVHIGRYHLIDKEGH